MAEQLPRTDQETYNLKQAMRAQEGHTMKQPELKPPSPFSDIEKRLGVLQEKIGNVSHLTNEKIDTLVGIEPTDSEPPSEAPAGNSFISSMDIMLNVCDGGIRDIKNQIERL